MHLHFKIKFYLWPMWLGACYGLNICILWFFIFFMTAHPHITRVIANLVVVATTKVQNPNSKTMNYNTYVHMFNTLVFKLQKKTSCDNGMFNEKIWCKTLSQKKLTNLITKCTLGFFESNGNGILFTISWLLVTICGTICMCSLCNIMLQKDFSCNQLFDQWHYVA